MPRQSVAGAIATLHDAKVSADSAEREATRLADEAKEARREWSQKVVHKGLSPNRMQMEVTQHRDGAMAGVLSGVQRRVGGTIRGRLVDLASEVEQSAPEDLDELSGVARAQSEGPGRSPPPTRPSRRRPVLRPGKRLPNSPD